MEQSRQTLDEMFFLQKRISQTIFNMALLVISDTMCLKHADETESVLITERIEERKKLIAELRAHSSELSVLGQILEDSVREDRGLK